jgi:hypothetical protein
LTDYFTGETLVNLGERVYTQLQDFVANNEHAVYLARRIHGLTKTAELAAAYIDPKNEQLKALQELLVEMVGLLEGASSSLALISISST